MNTSRGALIALNQEDGAQKWTISTEVPNLTLRGDSRPTAVAGGVFWGTPSGRLAAAIAERGQLIWQQPVGQPKVQPRLIALSMWMPPHWSSVARCLRLDLTGN